MSIRARNNHGVVVADGEGLCDKHVCIRNDVGGTEFLPKGRYRVEITRGWDDYETGRRLVGKLLDKEDVKTAVKVGTTQSKPKLVGWEPEVVYFSGYNFEEEGE